MMMMMMMMVVAVVIVIAVGVDDPGDVITLRFPFTKWEKGT